MHRRTFLTRSLIAGGATALAPPLAVGASAEPEPDDLGIILPEGYTATVVGTSGQKVPGTDYVWHTFPDGGATFADPDGGWAYVSNSEVDAPGGGAGVLRFDERGRVTDAYRIIGGSARNCAGGPTPWKTWLSGEEVERGRIWEADPFEPDSGEPRPALGRFLHEAAAVDPTRKVLYLTEDAPDGRFYRFVPDAYPSLEAGTLQAAKVDGDGAVTWIDIPDPTAAKTPTRKQTDATVFAGGEGIWLHEDTAWFTTKYDNRVWELDLAAQRITVLYDASTIDDPPLTGVDNITRARNGDLYVCEDGGNMELVTVDPQGTATPFLRVTGQDQSELTGVAFSPDGRHLYVSSQRGGPSGGITYAITGPFAGADPAPGATTTTSRAVTSRSASDDGGGSDDDGQAPLVVGGIAVVGAAALGGAIALRRRRGGAGGADAPH